jgi:hypothetical protein
MELQNSPKGYVPSLTQQENEELQWKYSAPRICTMGPIEIQSWSMALLLKVYVITGWEVPAKDLLTVLVDQFEKHLKESYGTLNVDEIEFAFRKYGTSVKDWGKQMNLSLIDSVLAVYLSRRSQLSMIEEQHKVARLKIKPKEDTSDEAMNKWLNELKSQNLDLLLLPEMLYDWLVKKEMLQLTVDQKYLYVQKATGYRHSKLNQAYAEAMTISNRKALNEFLGMKQEGVFIGKEAEALKSLAKKMALQDYLKIMI